MDFSDHREGSDFQRTATTIGRLVMELPPPCLLLGRPGGVAGLPGVWEISVRKWR